MRTPQPVIEMASTGTAREHGMRWLTSTLVIVAITACGSWQPRSAADIASPLRLDSLTVSQIAPDAFRIDQLILADTAVAMALRDDPCPTIDRTLASWANGAEAFNLGVRLGTSVVRVGSSARAAHAILDAGFVLAGAAGGIFVLEEINQQPRDFGGAQAAIGIAAVLKLIDMVVWSPVADDSRVVAEVGRKFAALELASSDLSGRIVALRARCRDPGFDRQIAQLRAHQRGLVSDFVTLVDRVPARYSTRDHVLMSFRQRARIYQMQIDAASR
jgi:hypothetical protein